MPGLPGRCLAANERAAAHVAADQSFGFQLRVGIGDRGPVYTELHGKLPARGNAVTRTQIAAVHEGAELVAELHIERNMALWL